MYMYTLIVAFFKSLPPRSPSVPAISSTTSPKSWRMRGLRVQCSISQWQFSAVKNSGTIAGTIKASVTEWVCVYWTDIMVDNNGQHLIVEGKHVTFLKLIPCNLVCQYILKAWCWTSSQNSNTLNGPKSHPRISDSSHPIWSYQTLYGRMYTYRLFNN